MEALQHIVGRGNVHFVQNENGMSDGGRGVRHPVVLSANALDDGTPAWISRWQVVSYRSGIKSRRLHRQACVFLRLMIAHISMQLLSRS